MSENAVTTTDQDLSMVEWRERGDIVAFSRRLRTMLPGGNRLSPENAMALAQYSLAMNLNPFRGEVHGFESKGKFVIVDGYKALVRWAQWRAPYTESFEQMQPSDPELFNGAIGFRCSILRQDRLPVLAALVQAGVPYDVALAKIETTAVGVVDAGEMSKAPPTGWTWEQRARIRALKNALNMSHGMPSPAEIQHAAEAEAERYDDDLTRDEALPVQAPQGRAVLFKTEARPQVVEAEIVAPDDDDCDWDADDDPRDPHDDDPAPDPRPAQPKPVRPYDPETLREGVQAKVARRDNSKPATQAQQGLVASKLSECFAGEPDANNKRHSVMGYLVGKTSVKELTFGEASVLLDWLVDPATVPNSYDLNAHVAAEAHGVLRLALVEAGQEEMEL